MSLLEHDIIAVDFDGTLCVNKWPGIGAPNKELFSRLIRMQKEGCKIILWTCRTRDELREAVEFCIANGLIFDAVNENFHEVIDLFGKDCRKIYADYYIDDKFVRLNLPFKG